MSEMILPSTMVSLLVAFEPCVSAPSYRAFSLLVAGWMHCLGRRTVTAVAVASGGVDRRHISVFHRFFSRATWSLDALGQVVCRPASTWIPADGPRLVRIDDTLARKTGQGVSLAVLTATATGTVSTTADIERLNATFRARLAPLTRRGRAVARTEPALVAGLWLVGTASNVCWPHDSPRQRAPDHTPRTWLRRTPAMAAGLADHCWTPDELLRLQIPLPRRVPPTRRGHPPRRPPRGAAT